MSRSADDLRSFEVRSIGHVAKNTGGCEIRLDAKYASALTGLSGFGHAVVVWWADKYDEYRDQVDMVMDLPYAPGVKAGLFATRSPVRPNPICTSVVELGKVDELRGTLEVDEIDAADGTAVLDVKPYYGTSDRVQSYQQPAWVPEEWTEWRVPGELVDIAGACAVLPMVFSVVIRTV